MTENFPKFMIDIKPQIPEAQRSPSKIAKNLYLGILYSHCRKSKTETNKQTNTK